MKTNKEEIRKQYVEDLQFIEDLARTYKVNDRIFSESEIRIIQQCYEHTRILHILAALNLYAVTKNKDLKNLIPATEQFKEMFEAMQRIRDSAGV